MKQDIEIFSVIEDDVEVGTTPFVDDANAMVSSGKAVFIDKPKPKHVKYKEWDDHIEEIGYCIPDFEAASGKYE